MSQRQKILFIANQWPFPPDNGGKVKAYCRLQDYADKYDVDVLCLYDRSETLDAESVNLSIRTISAFPHPIVSSQNTFATGLGLVRSILTNRPYTVLKHWNKSLHHEIIKLLSSCDYEFVVLNHFSMSVYFNTIHNRGLRVVVDTDNCESYLWRERAKTQRGIHKVVSRLESYKLQKAEAYIYRNSALTLCLTEADKKQMVHLSPDGRYLTVPVVLSRGKFMRKPDREARQHLSLLFVGTMTWFPNHDGLEWFFDEVAPHIASHVDWGLTIIGKGVPSQRLMDKISRYENVNFVGYVESLEEYYYGADYTIVPLRVGSGLKIKVVESLSLMVPVISTSVGAEGTSLSDGVNGFITDDPILMAKHIEQIWEDASLQQQQTQNLLSLGVESGKWTSALERLPPMEQ